MSTTKADYSHRRQQWANALKSGLYKQIRGSLRDDKGYCCLGVACEIYKQNTGHGKWVNDSEYSSTIEDFSVGGDEGGGSLPYKVEQYFGLTNEVGALEHNYKSTEQPLSLATANDSYRYSFKEIASLIESGKVKVTK